MIYKVEFTKSAQKELDKLPQGASKRIMKSINKLAGQPRSGSVRPMVGSTSWRLRVGDYRVIYDILDEEVRVLIIKVKHRKEAYR
jgi:mRNA interferase RelE/StbE